MSEYLKRNLAVCNAFGVKAGIDAARKRMGDRKDCPQWLLHLLDDLSLKSARTTRSMVQYRAESND